MVPKSFMMTLFFIFKKLDALMIIEYLYVVMKVTINRARSATSRSKKTIV